MAMTTGSSYGSNMWFSLKYLLWPGFRRRYEAAFTHACRKRQEGVQARLAEKEKEQKELHVRLKAALQGTVLRGVASLHETDERAKARMQAKQLEVMKRMQTRINALKLGLDARRPQLEREGRLRQFAELEASIRPKGGATGKGP
mmetsp:Transcript_28326/g.66432  ORF Transcript_28326/g.66432 Transcript_28326/m.66432 type:complete len:145 (+) Transcript_28326:1787-2221(+)